MLCRLKNLPLFVCLRTHHFMLLYSIRSKLPSTLWAGHSVVILVYFYRRFCSLLDWGLLFRTVTLLLLDLIFLSLSERVGLWAVIISSGLLLKAWWDHLYCSLLLDLFLGWTNFWVFLLDHRWLVDFSCPSESSSKRLTWLANLLMNGKFLREELSLAVFTLNEVEVLNRLGFNMCVLAFWKRSVWLV